MSPEKTEEVVVNQRDYLMPPEMHAGKYAKNEVMQWLGDLRQRNEELKKMEKPHLFDRVWLEEVDGGAMVWSTGMVKSDEKEFPNNGLLWGIWVNEDQKQEWEEDIKSGDEAKNRFADEIKAGMKIDDKMYKRGILDVHGWGGQETGRMHDLRDTLVNIKNEGGDPSEYFVLAQTLMGGLGTRKEEARSAEIDINMIPGQLLSGLKNVALELALGDKKAAQDMINNLALVQGHSMGGFVVSKSAMIIEGIAKGYSYEKLADILGKDKSGDNYLSQDLFNFYKDTQINAQWIAFNPVIYGNLNKKQQDKMNYLMNERRKPRKSKQSILLRQNPLIRLWGSKLLPPEISIIGKVPGADLLFERVIDSVFGKKGVADDGGWRKWVHLYTALHERDYIVDCNEMLGKPIMLAKTEDELDLLKKLSGEGGYILSAGDVADGVESRLESGDDVLLEWVGKFFALAINSEVFLPTDYHYPQIGLAKSVAKILLVGKRAIGESYTDYITNRLGSAVRHLSAPMESVAYKPRIFSKTYSS